MYIGNVNMSALMEYLRKDAQYRIRLNELESITEERNNMRKIYEVVIVYNVYILCIIYMYTHECICILISNTLPSLIFGFRLLTLFFYIYT